ncbi:MAG: pentapeptide repeat-containing protein [Thermoplasmata archaeon]|nr:pentapeptide repeat-containing protein [Thermoplasmata archaeon]
MTIGGRIEITSSRVTSLCADHCIFLDEVRFVNCRFDGVTSMIGAEFRSGCTFEGCNFAYAVMTGMKVREGASFHRSRFSQLVDLSGGTFDKLDLTESIVVETLSLKGITAVPLADEDDEDPKTGLIMNDMTVMGHVYNDFADSPDDKANRQFLDDFARVNSADGIGVMRSILEDSDRCAWADEAFVLKKRKEREDLKGRKLIRSYLSDWLGGYGMHPLKALVAMVVVMVAFTAVIALVGICCGNPDMGMGAADPLLLSVMSYFSLSVWELDPIYSVLRIVCLVEGIIGLLLTLYFTVILTRKIVR